MHEVDELACVSYQVFGTLRSHFQNPIKKQLQVSGMGPFGLAEQELRIGGCEPTMPSYTMLQLDLGAMKQLIGVRVTRLSFSGARKAPVVVGGSDQWEETLEAESLGSFGSILTSSNPTRARSRLLEPSTTALE